MEKEKPVSEDWRRKQFSSGGSFPNYLLSRVAPNPKILHYNPYHRIPQFKGRCTKNTYISRLMERQKSLIRCC